MTTARTRRWSSSRQSAASLHPIGVELANSPLPIGDRITYGLPVDFAEEDITSLEVGKSSVDKARAGAQAGIKTSMVHQLQKAQSSTS